MLDECSCSIGTERLISTTERAWEVTQGGSRAQQHGALAVMLGLQQTFFMTSDAETHVGQLVALV